MLRTINEAGSGEACLPADEEYRVRRARSQGTFQADGYEIRIAADFSKETNEHRKGFLSLHPRLRQMEVKYGLFELARMWVTKNRLLRTGRTTALPR
ncbi:hypothetical protein NDU88_001631 [Pleurodeles waltl]|uniref:Uncharacterized protein n=1 Tax=Pleurodeles waltl TaxID=8319 RepID=A0AAV7NBB5_PLEWA|nr:hypothetical protein NDU88_001631 [Pleurodeles waltl]